MDDTTARVRLSSNIRRMIENRGWSLRELSRRSGEDPMTISRLLNQKVTPSIVTLSNIAEALETSIDHLLYPTEEKLSASA